MKSAEPYSPRNHVRVVTATALFDGHDVAINIIRRILQDSGAEVIHLGHNRSAAEIVSAAIQEDAQGLCVSSYQGGHVEFFRYLMELLRERGADHIRVFGGGGGVIVPAEIRQIEAMGATKIFSPEDGRTLGLQGMINVILESIDCACETSGVAERIDELTTSNSGLIARYITAVEEAKASANGQMVRLIEPLSRRIHRNIPILGVTGTGGAGKSSLVDELVVRFTHDFPDKRAAVVSIDPSRRRSGGALLGDRIRMNSLRSDRVYMRSLSTRGAQTEIADALGEVLIVLRAADFDWIIVETAGIGQGDAAIVPHVDVTAYVMTSDYGSPSQLEKIEMLDLADIVVINKFDHRGAEDALRDVRKQYQRNRRRFDEDPANMPVYGTMAARFNDDGLTALYQAIVKLLMQRTGAGWQSSYPASDRKMPSVRSAIIPPERVQYLAEIADTVERYHQKAAEQAGIVERLWQINGAIAALGEDHDESRKALEDKRGQLAAELTPDTQGILERIPVVRDQYLQDEIVYTVRGREFHTPVHRRSLSGTKISRVALPRYTNPGDQVRWITRENLPGRFPFTAGVFPFRRGDEDPTRMFAGEGDPERTNRRFKYLSQGHEAARLSTAFDSITLYGRDPDTVPDICGKIGTSGVSICTLDDMKVLYGGFDLCAPNTSVSMTINGPAPIALAMFFNTAIDQQLARNEAEYGRPLSADEVARFKAWVLQRVRGTVQADVLKEDQGQNTCIFAIDFALRMMGDIQEYFIEHAVRNFYSVSISGYHIAEAGANPITQLAFTLANGFTYVEYLRSRGLNIDDFAPNLSFFFSNGMDPEYAVLNRVARRIWAVAMRDKYGANERSQKLKAHIQTSGRSLHAHEIQFNDIRTTLQALAALNDNCNSLHTNSYDESVTTPSEESVRRALAIQLIINREFGTSMNENSLQGSFFIEELTELVEQAVLQEFRRLADRGGVLGAMELGYQRARIQDESLYYETRKVDGSLPIIGVNTFINAHEDLEAVTSRLDLARATEEEKQSQLDRLRAFHKCHAGEAPEALQRLKKVALSGGNIFAELMETVRSCSLGQITEALFEVGGQYRRNM
ncbi:MAG TPA: methylmalonyl-CoA mutase family protein [Candidatus Hydrogenedentes bacterium]|nr:methylmalonyl-CoA mutase family protein [Candidatus Hydrogenedentota bacterium]HPG67840.1 methylmalonyl-CoA mutase family protein [Candidatus Hydrogenedentota bacterium]